MEDCQREMPFGEWMARLYEVIDRQRLEITRLTAENAALRELLDWIKTESDLREAGWGNRIGDMIRAALDAKEEQCP